MAGPLKGVKVLDLSRILAGPWATQVLADYGADVIKVERPQTGDDTRQWGPPYASSVDDSPFNDAGYFLSANRGKRSLTLDISKEQGQQVVRELIKQCDVLVENYKVGGLKKYGLDYQSVKKINSKIIYCSITGFGQTGPYRERPGYDAVIQGMGGLMSITGEPEDKNGEPQKVGVAVADLMTGMYAVSAITAALYHQSQTGEGQYIDLALLDTQVAWLANQNMNYLLSGVSPPRHGTSHPNIVPYQSVKAKDGYFILAVGNDQQFEKLAKALNLIELAQHPDFSSNSQRVRNRDLLLELIHKVLMTEPCSYWLSKLEEFGVPCAPINNLEQVFSDPQILARELRFELEHSHYGSVPQVANPVKFSESKIEYHKAPPSLGEHSIEILRELGMNDLDIQVLKENNIF